MEGFNTKYGVIKSISDFELYPSGGIKECKLNEYFEIPTVYGTFVPQHEDAEVRRKYTKSMSFYDNGNIQSISLQEQTKIKTSIGELPIERALFYENGNVKRVFPLNGKITAYWTEENEYSLAEEMEFKFKFGKFTKKIIGISFYEDGSVKSITFWPKESVQVDSAFGIVDTRIGISLYQNGALKSCEPKKEKLIKTAIGSLHAFDASAVGINGDKNSLNFNENGSLKSLVTSRDKVEIVDKNGKLIIFQPSLKPNLFNNLVMDVIPLKVEFFQDRVRFNNKAENEFKVKENMFTIKAFIRKVEDGCKSCSECSGCN